MFKLCTNFSMFPDNHQLGPNFTLSGMKFHDLGPSASFVNDTQSTRGLQFFDQGLEITLPTPAKYVDLQLGQFNSDFVIEAYDPGGKLISNLVVSAPNTFMYQQIIGPDVSHLRFLGGGNEAVVVEICMLVP